MKKFDKAIENLQNTLLKEVRKYKITVDTDHGDWMTIVACMRYELDTQKHDNNYTIDACAFVSWNFTFEDYSVIGRRPCVKTAIYASAGNAHLNDSNVLLFETKDYKQAFDAAVENIETAPEYAIYWDYDPTLKQKIAEAIRHNFFSYCTSETGQQLNAYTTYKLYQRKRKDDDEHIIKWLQIDVHAPGVLDVAKELTQDDTNDISNW